MEFPQRSRFAWKSRKNIAKLIVNDHIG